jgi:crossover junction endodeoxyribonuclease RuvC
LRVLGIDPGSRFTGYGVVEARGSRLCHLAHGVIRTDLDAPLEVRLKSIFEQLTEAAAQHQPEAVAVEGLFSFRNARSALVLGHARGIALLVAAQSGLPVYEYAPAKVKRAVGAGGAGGKDAVARMVHTFLGLGALIPSQRMDATDALAVAICHLNQGRLARQSPPARKRGALATFAERLLPAYQRFGTAR